MRGSCVGWNIEEGQVADECLQTKLSPKKAQLLKHIHATGAVPEGFLEEEVTDLQVRLRNEPVQEAA